MAPVQPIRGVVQHYEWGDRTLIPTLLGVSPDGRPWAELWLGTHPNGPATLPDGRPLIDVTGPLPYLLKVLSADRPLSLQAHPSAVQARAGYEAGRYPDPSAKPELLCALTPFTAFCGVRPVAATLDLLDELGVDELATSVRDDGVGPDPRRAVPRAAPRRADHRGGVARHRARGGVGAAAGRPLPG